LPIEDRWIIDGLDRTIAAATSDLERFAFAEVARRLRDFTWSEFCDWYLEFAKGRLRDPEARPTAQRVLAAVLDRLSRLLHPIMPFVTEQVWQGLAGVAPSRGLPSPRPAEESVCVAAWPEPLGWSDEDARRTVDQWCEAIKAIRNLRAERNVPKDAKVAPIIAASGPAGAMLRRGERYLRSLSPAESVTIVDSAVDRPAECAVAVLPDAEIILPLAGLIDREAELAKQRKALADLEKQIDGHRSKLSNESFVARAPAEVVEQARAKLAELESQREAVLSLVAGR
jgi:valyl-tRNA synthetase